MKRAILLVVALSLLALSCTLDLGNGIILGAIATPTFTKTPTITPTSTATPSLTATATPNSTATKSKSQLFEEISAVLGNGVLPEGYYPNGPYKQISPSYYVDLPTRPAPFILIYYEFFDDARPNWYWGIVTVWYYQDQQKADEMWDGVTDPNVMLYGEFSSNYGQGVDTCFSLLFNLDNPDDWLAQKAFRPTTTTIVYISFFGGPKDQMIDYLETYEASILKKLITVVS
jgi:hypothetical protein